MASVSLTVFLLVLSKCHPALPLPPGTYGPLQDAYTADIAKANPSSLHTVEKKVGTCGSIQLGELCCAVLFCVTAALCVSWEQFLKKPIKDSSDVWETLGLQAMERCEVTMAYGLLHLVLLRPGRPGLAELDCVVVLCCCVVL